MGGMVNAHIFGRRKRGDRDEVRMQMFDMDGKPMDLGSGVNPLDVAPVNIDVSTPWPSVSVDCKDYSLIHVRKLTVPNTATGNLGILVYLNDIAVGTPYHISVDNLSNFAHTVNVFTNGTPVDPIVTAAGISNMNVFLPPQETCSIMSLYTGSADLALASVSRPGSRPFKRVTTNYILALDYDINPLIVVNSSGPATVTLRDQGQSNWWWEGEEVEIYQEGAGAVTVAAPAGTTITRPGGATGNFNLPGRYCTVKLRCTGFQKWVVTDWTPATGI
jgi:hypothetical protein